MLNNFANVVVRDCRSEAGFMPRARVVDWFVNGQRFSVGELQGEWNLRWLLTCEQSSPLHLSFLSITPFTSIQ